MRDDTNWSLSVGRWADIHVRLHASLILCAAAMLHLGARFGGGDSVGAALVGIVVYLIALTTRELARSITAWKCDERVERILLGPAGGFVRPTPSLDPRCDLAVAAAGPSANLVVALLAVLATVALRQPVGPLFVPFAPPSAAFGFSLVGLLALVGWMNWTLFLVSLIPAAPLNGSQIVLALCRQRLDESAARAATARIGILASFVLFLVGWLVRPAFETGSLVVSLMSIALFFSSHRELYRAIANDDEGEADDDDLPPADHEERRIRTDRIGPLRRWWRQRQELRRRVALETEREEEVRADEVLARLHSQGLNALTPAERALLERVSARYRRRQHQG